MTGALTIRRGSISEVLYAANFQQLSDEYAQEGAIEGMPPPKAKFEQYLQFEAVGALRTFVAVKEDSGTPLLIGFLNLLITDIPHYSAPLAVCESFFVLVRHRKGGAGLKLLKAAEAHACESGAPGLGISAPIGGVLAQVLPKSGYRPTNMAFFKQLGRNA